MNNLMKNLEKSIKSLGRAIDKHSPEILIGCGIVGFISTAVLVAKEAPVAKEKLDDLHKELAKSDEELTKAQVIFEEVKTALPVYAPAVVTGAVSTACILGSYKINSGRSAALATAYELSQARFAEYKSKVTEKIGEKKENEIENEIIHDHIVKNQPTSSQVMMTDGMSLFYDDTSGRYFRSTVDHIRQAENEINRRLRNGEPWVELNDFYYELGMSSTKLGEFNGFFDQMGDIDIRLQSTIAPDGTAILALVYDTMSKDYFREKYM